jgi:hypothetical protein
LGEAPQNYTVGGDAGGDFVIDQTVEVLLGSGDAGFVFFLGEGREGDLFNGWVSYVRVKSLERAIERDL